MSRREIALKLSKRVHITGMEERRIFTQFEKFLAFSYYSIPKDFEFYNKNKISTWRFFIISIIKVLSILLGIRSLLNILWPTPYIRDLTCNAYHYLGSQVMINLVFLGGVISANMILAMTNQYFNLIGQSAMFRYMNKVKNQTLDYELKGRFRNKYFRYFKLLAKVVSTQFIPNCLLFTLIYCSPSVFGYFDPELNFSLMGELTEK